MKSRMNYGTAAPGLYEAMERKGNVRPDARDRGHQRVEPAIHCGSSRSRRLRAGRSSGERVK